jgi:hypothetical protein
MNRNVTLEVTLDQSTMYLLEIAADLSALTADELAGQILYRDMAQRTGWPGKDGLSLRTALRDFINGRAAEEGEL